MLIHVSSPIINVLTHLELFSGCSSISYHTSMVVSSSLSGPQEKLLERIWQTYTISAHLWLKWTVQNKFRSLAISFATNQWLLCIHKILHSFYTPVVFLKKKKQGDQLRPIPSHLEMYIPLTNGTFAKAIPQSLNSYANFLLIFFNPFLLCKILHNRKKHVCIQELNGQH